MAAAIRHHNPILEPFDLSVHNRSVRERVFEADAWELDVCVPFVFERVEGHLKKSQNNFENIEKKREERVPRLTTHCNSRDWPSQARKLRKLRKGKLQQGCIVQARFHTPSMNMCTSRSLCFAFVRRCRRRVKVQKRRPCFKKLLMVQSACSLLNCIASEARTLARYGWRGIRVGDADHPGPLFTKHLKCQHCSSWFSSSSSLSHHVRQKHRQTVDPCTPVVLTPPENADERRALKRGDAVSSREVPKRPRTHVECVASPNSCISVPCCVEPGMAMDEFSLDWCGMEYQEDVIDLSELPSVDCAESQCDDCLDNAQINHAGDIDLSEVSCATGEYLVGSSNITSLATQWDMVMSSPFHVHAVQETKMTKQWQLDIDQIYDKQGWTVIWGKPVPEGRTLYEGRSGGVAVFVREGLPCHRVDPKSEVTKRLWETGRWVHAAIAYGNASQTLHIFSIYGHTNARQCKPDIMARNEAFLSDVMAAAAELGNVPILILGDFNVPPSISAVLQSALSSGRWFDAALSFACASSEAPANTCFVRETSVGSRIDLAFCNNIAMSAVRRVSTVAGSGIPTHVPLALWLSLSEYGQLVPTVRRPVPFPKGWQDASKDKEIDISVNVAASILAESAVDWQLFLASGEVDSLWQSLCADIETYFLNRARQLITAPQHRYRGRGEVRSSRKQLRVAPQKDGTGAMPIRSRRLLKLTRRIEEIVRQLAKAAAAGTGIGVTSHRCVKLWQLSKEDGRDLFRDHQQHHCYTCSGTACLSPSGLECCQRPKRAPRCPDGGMNSHAPNHQHITCERSFSFSLHWAFAQEAVPPLSALQQLTKELRGIIQSEQSEDRSRRVETWRSHLQDDWSKTRSGVFAWCKGKSEHKPMLLKTAEGGLTGNVEEMDRLLHEAWMPIFQMYAGSDEPAWEPFASRFQRHFPRPRPMERTPLTVERLRRTIDRMKSNSSCGLDSWTVADLKMLPDSFLERLVAIYHIIEHTGVWPDALTHGKISLLSKGEGAEPDKLRPITVMSVFYRLWAGTRLRDLLPWQESWADDCLHGYRPGRSAETVWWKLALKVERALLEEGHLAGISLDYSKCFDRVPMNIVLKLAQHMGMAPGIVVAVRGMAKSLKRRFAIGGGLGQPFVSTNGILQGCPLSVIFLNLLVNVWAHAVKAEVPDAEPYGFADDTGATAAGPDTLQSVLDITGSYASLTGQMLNAGKSACWTTSDMLRKEVQALALNGQQLKHVAALRVLGGQLSFCKTSFSNPVASKAIEQAVETARRIRWAPLPMGSRAELVASLVNPRALHSHASVGVSSSLMKQLRPACLSAVWGSTRKLKAPELVLTLLVKGHRVDPVQYAAVRGMNILRRMLTECADILADFHNVWWAYENGAGRVPGPIGVLKRSMQNMNWTWVTPDLIRRPEQSNLSITRGPSGWWHHQIREGLRCAEWRKVATRRKDCDGLDNAGGVDKDVTLKMLNSAKTSAQDKGLLRSILSGSLRLGERLFKASIWQSPVCIFLWTSA